MTSQSLLQLQNVSRALAGRIVVENVNFQLGRGSVLGLLGVNGAGKSTTLRMIAGVLAPSSGNVLLDGQDLYEHALIGRNLGYLPERAPLYPELRVHEYLEFCARLHGVSGKRVAGATAAVIERCALGDVRRRLLGNLSKGFQQRVGIAAAIVHEPALIVLDEPASGLDPLQAVKIRELVRELGRERALILSTHLLADVEACCDRVIVLHRGRLRHDAALRAPEQGATMRVVLRAAVNEVHWEPVALVRAAQFEHDAWRVELAPGATAEQLAAVIVANAWGLRELRAASPSLEQMFLAIASADDVEAAA